MLAGEVLVLCPAEQAVLWPRPIELPRIFLNSALLASVLRSVQPFLKRLRRRWHWLAIWVLHGSVSQQTQLANSLRSWRMRAQRRDAVPLQILRSTEHVCKAMTKHTHTLTLAALLVARESVSLRKAALFVSVVVRMSKEANEPRPCCNTCNTCILAKCEGLQGSAQRLNFKAFNTDTRVALSMDAAIQVLDGHALYLDHVSCACLCLPPRCRSCPTAA